MFTMYQFAPAFDLASGSPFCLKLQTYLKFANIQYSIKNVVNPNKSPTGKFPLIEIDGKKITDSECIICVFKRAKKIDLDSHYSEEQLIKAQPFIRMLEEHYYHVVVYSRWMEDDNFEKVKSVFFKPLPFFLRGIIAKKARKSVEVALWNQGLFRHDKETIYKKGIQDLKALFKIMDNDKPYFLGDKPSTVDSVIFAMLASTLLTPMQSPLKEFIASNKRAVEFVKSTKKQLF